MEPSAAILPRLKTQMAGLPALLDGVPRDRFDRRTGDKWSVTETLAHLARYHELHLERMRAILAEDEPRFQAYRAERDPEWPAWRVRSFEDVMLRLRASRATLVEIVEHLTPDQWLRTGRHAELGVLSLRSWLELFLVHEGHHLYTIIVRARRADEAADTG